MAEGSEQNERLLSQNNEEVIVREEDEEDNRDINLPERGASEEEEEYQRLHSQQQSQQQQIGNNFTEKISHRLRRFGVIGREVSFAIRSLPESGNMYRFLENVFREIHAYAINLSEPSDYVGLSFDSPNLSREFIFSADA